MSGEAGGRDLTLAALLREASARLTEARVPSPEHDAVALLAQAIGMTPPELRTAAARGDGAPSIFDPVAFGRLVERRVGREPLQHLTGLAPFRGLEILVGPGVFVPRPETEVVAGAAIEEALARMGRGQVVVADLCAGSGAIGLAVAHEVPKARVTLVEVDDEALPWLRRNVEAAQPDVATRVEVVHADAARALPERSGEYDIVVANPPYIPPDGVPVAPEASHDPARSLWGLGEDGLEVPRAIVVAAARLLRRGGVLVMEHADTQGPAIREELVGSGTWEDVRTGRDLTGRERFALAIRA